MHITEVPLEESTPHGHTAATSRRDGRLLIRVWMRPGQGSQMMPNGRGYSGEGPHEFEIYKSDLRHVEGMVETEPEMITMAEKITAKKIDEWVVENHEPRERCPINVPAEYRLLTRRDILPIVRFEVVEELVSVREQARLAEEARVRAAQPQASEIAGAFADALRSVDLAPVAKAGK